MGAIPGRRLAWQRLPRASFAAGRNILRGWRQQQWLHALGVRYTGAGPGDEQLFALVGAGDERAFEEIVLNGTGRPAQLLRAHAGES